MTRRKIVGLLEDLRELVEAPVVPGPIHKQAADAMRHAVQLVDDELEKRLAADAFAKSVANRMNKHLELGLTTSDVKSVWESEEAMVARRRLALVVGRELLPEME